MSGSLSTLRGFATAALLVSSLCCGSAYGATILDDSFTRTESADWGTADTGGTWAGGGGTTPYTVDGSEGLISPASGSNDFYCFIGSSITDVEATGKQQQRSSTTYRTYFGLRTDFAESTHTAGYLFRWNNSSTDTLKIYTRVSSSDTEIASVNKTVGTQSMDFHIIVVDDGSDTDLYFSSWLDSGSEPGAWDVSGTDTTTDHSSGKISCMVNAGSSGQNSDWDNLLVEDYSADSLVTGAVIIVD